MSSDSAKIPRLEWILAELLHYGTWIASSVIGLGLILAAIQHSFGSHNPAGLLGIRIVTAGIAFLILLPVVRVTLMLIVFVRQRESSWRRRPQFH